MRGAFIFVVVNDAGNSSKNCNVRRKQSEAAAALAAGGRIGMIFSPAADAASIIESVLNHAAFRVVHV